jgi:hypothetical protein
MFLKVNVNFEDKAYLGGGHWKVGLKRERLSLGQVVENRR